MKQKSGEAPLGLLTASVTQTASMTQTASTTLTAVRRRAQPRGSMAPSGTLAVGRYLGTVVVTVHGELALPIAAALADVLRDLIDGQGNLAVVVDLRHVGGIDRCGLDVLASAAGRIAERGGALGLGGPTGAVSDALTVAGLARLITHGSAHRPSTQGPGAGAVRRAAMNVHPAGKGG